MNNKSEIVKYIYITIASNLFIAFIMFLYLTTFDFNGLFKFLLSLWLNLSIGILGLFFVGKIVGDNLWKLKLRKRKYKIIHGIIAIFIVLIFGVLIGSCVGFIQEGLPNIIKNQKFYKLSDEIYDYFFKPLYWILLFGFIPTLLSGIFLGVAIKRLSK